MNINPQSLARALGGEVAGNSVIAPGPGHSPDDRSMSILVDPSAPDGFVVNSFADNDPIECKDYVRERAGLARFESKKQRRSKSNGHIDRQIQPDVLKDELPLADAQQFLAGDLPIQSNEVHRYVYRRADSTPVKIVIRFNPKTFRPWYAIRKGNQVGWQPKKPAGFVEVPYNLQALLDPETASDDVNFCEGEKDVDQLTSEGFLAVTYGAAAQCPEGVLESFRNRVVIVIGDYDSAGDKHVIKVPAALEGIAGAIKSWRIEHPESDTPKGFDVSDYFAAGGTAEGLRQIIDALPNAASSATTEKLTTNTPADDDDFVSEDSAALAFVARYGKRVRFDHDHNRWYAWQDTHWQRDETGLAFNWNRGVARQMAARETPNIKRQAGKAAFASGVERFAQHDRQVAVKSDIWDCNPMLIGTPGGTVDLRTGQLSKANPTNHITKLTTVAPAEGEDCPRWHSFLLEATGNDRELINSLQRWCGYCLTGSTSENVLVFIYGGGGNGKSVFVNTLLKILGSYGCVAQMATFTAKKFDSHPEELASLQGARVVSASETDEGRSWSEARVKQLTGADTIRARFMRQDSFEYRPAFKLMFQGNHTPQITNLDDAMKRRFRLVPFTQKPKVPDAGLEAKLERELPGILRWMINGSLLWQESGLLWPASVQQATRDYFSDQDMFGQWLDDNCTVEPGNPHKCESSKALFENWTKFATESGETPGKIRTFNANMQRRGFVKKQLRAIQTKGYEGIEIKRVQNHE